jgi:hypothetical protein
MAKAGMARATARGAARAVFEMFTVSSERVVVPL